MWAALATNHRYAKYVSLSDVNRISEMYEARGYSAFTVDLPSYGKWLESLSSLAPVEQPGPLLFDRLELDCLAGDPAAVECHRQLTLMFYKLKVPFTPEVISTFLDNFVSMDAQCPDFFELEKSASLLDRARSLIGTVLMNQDPHDIIPRHGPGATSCRTKVWDKYHQLRYFPKLDNVYSYSEYFFMSPTHLADELDRLENAKEGVPQARVILVPKDSRGPRVISAEPAEFMYIQQGIRRKLYEIVEKHYLTAGFVNFTDQGINRYLALQGSLSGNVATLDMKDASDRVSWDLVRWLFPSNWVEALDACRSPETLLPDGRVVQLRKFAPMGSACCFPVEALVFWAISRAAISLDLGQTNPEVFVYGDDIIVSSKTVQAVIRGLESVGLMVNRSKSFEDGPFRESCGSEYYKGLNVAPVRVKTFPNSVDTSRHSDADLCNEFIAKYGISDAHWMIRILESFYSVPFPRSELPLPGVIKAPTSVSNDIFFRKRYNKSLCRWEYRVPKLVMLPSRKHEPAWCELLKRQLSLGDGVMEDQIKEKPLKPGYYVDAHDVRKGWAWRWLG
jgi:hypothetical protein